jgi:hypothetical protein
MADVENIFSALELEVKELRSRFIDKFIPANPEHEPSDFEHDVKAFSVLCHAAFEEFIETISEFMMKKIEIDFMGRKTSLGTSILLMSYSIKIEFSENDDEENDSCFDQMRGALSKAKEMHSRVIKDNHGISVKYLRKLLIPVGINVPSGPRLVSLKKLAEARGSFAHTMAKLAQYGEHKRATKVLTPEEALGAGLDCLELCRDIKDRTKTVW